MRILTILIILLNYQLLFATFNDLLIDPGHGGGDPGALGWANTNYGVTYYSSEDDINLDLTEYVDDIINNEIWRGFTRVSDDWYYISTADRAKIANGLTPNEDGVYSTYGFAVSIHQNSSTSSIPNYMRIYYSNDWHWDPNATQYSHSIKSQEGNELGEVAGERIWQNIGNNNYNIWTDEYDNNWAIQNDSSISNFIDGTHCPSIIIECGFLSNQDYYEHITDNWSFIYDMYNGIADGIDDYFDELTDYSGDYINGDANVDGNLNILDIVSIVGHILTAPCENLLDGTGCLLNLPLWIADYNYDNSVDILDVVQIVNEILYPIIIFVNSDDENNNYITHNLEEDYYPYYFLDTYLLNSGVVQGISIAIDIPEGFETISVEKSEHAENMTLKFNPKYQDNEQKMKKVIYSAKGEYINNGSGKISRIKLKQNDGLGRRATKELLAEVKNVETILGTGNLEVDFTEVNYETYLQLLESNKNNQFPDKYLLAHVYPNPFNPITNITYEIPEESHITISIYDLAGRKLEDLVSGTVQAGRYNTTWNAEQFSSGVYFVTMTTPSCTATQKVVLIK